MIAISNGDATTVLRAISNLDSDGVKGANARRVLSRFASKLSRRMERTSHGDSERGEGVYGSSGR